MSDSRNAVTAAISRKRVRQLQTLCALSASAIAARAMANSGIQLPLSQYQAGQEHTTPVTNSGVEADGMGNVQTQAGWTRPVGDMIVNPVFNPPPANPGAVGSFAAQTSGTNESAYDQSINLDAGKNYLLSAYVWNRGIYNPNEVDG